MIHSESKMKIANRNAFLIIGAMEAAWAPMVPYVKQGFHLDEAQLGLLLLCTGLGSVLALPLAGPMCNRYGAKRTIYASGVLLGVALALVAANINLWMTAFMLVVFGMCTVTIDVAANVNGVTLEERFKKPMMSGFHGGYSLGTLIGAASMSMLLTMGIEILPAALMVLSVTLAYFFWGCQELLCKDELGIGTQTEQKAQSKSRFYIPPLVLLVGIACFVLYSSEGAVMSWSAVFVHQERGVDLRFAGFFYTAFAICMTVMRLCGNKLVKRFGARRIVVYGSVLVALGLLMVAFVPSLLVTIVGFALIGIGAANIVPQLMSYAGHIKGMSVQNIISVITALGYSGILLGPVIIGFCANQYGLPITFAGIGVVVALITGIIRYLYTKGENKQEK